MIIVLAIGAACPATPHLATPRDGQPPARMAERAYGYYDATLGRVVIVGGGMTPARGARDGAWSWNGARWEPVTVAGPPARLNAAAAFDPVARRALLVAGARRAADDSTFEVGGDTWTTAPEGWRRGPDAQARDHHALVDDGRGGVLLFGGIPAARGGPWPADTWVLRGERWQRVATEGPSGRARTALARDAARRRVVLFGGVGAPAGPDGAQTFLGDTWTWDGARWRRVASRGGPPARYAHAMVFDERARVVLLYGGSASHTGEPLTDMWKWDGRRWTRIPLAGLTPGFRYQPVMVYDRARGRTVLYGGLQGGGDETWEWDGTRWQAIAP